MSVAAGEHGRRVLIVDDDPSIVSLLAMRLGRLGYVTTMASDGEQALAAVREQRPDLVLLDVMMPKLSGWEVARSIRHDSEVAATKIVMLTAIGASMNAMTAPLYQVDAHLDKPFDFRELEKVLRELFDAGPDS